MTRYEKQKDDFLIYLIAKDNIYNNFGFWFTSDYKCFETTTDAIEHEIEWLK